MSDGLPLSEVLASLRKELSKAQDERDPLLPLRVKAIEVELMVEVTAQTELEAGINWLVVTKGSKDSASTRTHRLTLTIEPGLLDGTGDAGELLVSPTIAIPEGD
jgi:hypothetical protein